MGLLRAFSGAVGGSLADQWKDFFTVHPAISQTAAVFPAVLQGTNAGRGSNTHPSVAIITNGSRIVVPEGYGLLTFQDGALTGLVTEPGGYIWNSDDVNSQSVFVQGGLSPILSMSWDRFKFGGRPGSQQLALFVCLKELPNNRFGTQSPIYWDDGYLNAQVGATTRGTFTLRIVDPMLFVHNVVPAAFLQNGWVFDFTDPNNAVANQLLLELIGSLAAAFSMYTNDLERGNRITNIQRDAVGFATSLSQAVESNYRWTTDRGLTIDKVAIVGVEYDDPSRQLLQTVQRADALSGNRGNSNLQASLAAGLESAGAVDGAAGILGLGVAAAGVGVTNVQQPPPIPPAAPPPFSPSGEGAGSTQGDQDLVARLQQLKDAFDAGLITQEDFDAARAKALGL